MSVTRCVCDIQSSDTDGSVVAETALAVPYPGQAQQRLPPRVGRQRLGVNSQSRHFAQRANRHADAVQLLRASYAPPVLAALIVYRILHFTLYLGLSIR